MCVSKIDDFGYWAGKNFAYSNEFLTPTIRVGINYAIAKNAELAKLINGLDRLTNAGLVETIKRQIEKIADAQYGKHGRKEDTKDDAYLTVFDLIQGWGGQTGRNPYVQPKGNVARDQWGGWLAHYKDGATKALDGKREDALKSLKSIPQVGESFATKHLYFWGRGGEHHFPIYDTRMRTLLFFDEPQGASYDRFLQKLAELAAGQENLDTITVEKALFAFSSNYFPNGTLVLRNNYKDKVDESVAKALAAAYANPTQQACE